MCFDVIRPADGRYNQLTQQRHDGREGGVSKGELMELDQWECLGLVTCGVPVLGYKKQAFLEPSLDHQLIL